MLSDGAATTSSKGKHTQTEFILHFRRYFKQYAQHSDKLMLQTWI